MRSTAAITFVLAVLAAVGGTASPVEVLTPGVVTMDQDTGNVTIEGGVEVNQHPYTLNADAIRWNQSTQEIHALGNVQLWLQPDHGIALPQLPKRLIPRKGRATPNEEPQELLRAQALTYDIAQQVLFPEGIAAIYLGVARLLAEDLRFELESRAFTTGRYRAGLQTLYLEGITLESDGEAMLTHNARFFLGEPERLGINGRARKIEKIGPDSVRFHGAVVKVGPIPILYLPRYTHSFSRSKFSVDGSIGYTGGIGAYTEIRPIYTPFDHTHFFWDLNLYSQRGILTGPGFDIIYLPGKDDFLKAKLESGYIRDHGEVGKDSLGLEVPKNRHAIDAAIVYRRNREFQLYSTLQKWSDTEILRDFANNRFQRTQQPENFVEANGLSGNWAASVQTRFHLERFEYAVERLPEIRLERLPAPIPGTRLVYATRITWSKLRSVTPLETFALDYQRSEWDATLYYPLEIKRWLNWAPQAGIKALRYHEDRNAGESFHRVISEFGFNLDAHLFGEWKVENRIWNIRGMRHLVRPTVQVRRFAASGEVPLAFTPIERNRYRTGMDDLDLNATPFTDEIEDTTRLRIGVANTFIAKPFKGSTRRLAQIDLFWDRTWLDRSDGVETSRFITHLNLTPAPWLHFDLQSRINARNGNLGDLFGRIRVKDGDILEIDLSSQFIRNRIEQYHVRTRYKIRENLQLIAAVGFDSKDSRFYETTVGFQIVVSNYWDLYCSASKRDGSQRNNETRFEFKIVGSKF